MKILQISRHHWNYTIGGVELYVKDLIRGLRCYGIESAIVTFQDKDKKKIDDDKSCTLYAMPIVNARNSDRFRKQVTEIIKKESPDCAHFHLFKSEEAIVAAILKKENIPYIFTYHLPAASCYRGNLMRWGKQLCDSRVETMKCASCRIHNKLNTPPQISVAISILVYLISPWLKGRFEKINYWKSTDNYVTELREFLKNASVLISCAEWSMETLLVNGGEERNIHAIPQGLPIDFYTNELYKNAKCTRGKTIGYVGRISPEKGIEILIQAFKRIEDREARLEVYGFKNKNERSEFEKKIGELVKDDIRIGLHERLPQEKLKHIYCQFDYLAVPSTCRETGPLVIWEALSAGIPVIASDRIGHPDLLSDNRSGMIVSPHTIEEWERRLLNVLSGNAIFADINQKIRTMSDVVQDMIQVYKRFDNDKKYYSLNTIKNIATENNL